jgi:hypothetical protein
MEYERICFIDGKPVCSIAHLALETCQCGSGINLMNFVEMKAYEDLKMGSR